MSDYKRLTERNSVGLVDTLCKHCMFNADCTRYRTHCDRAVRERLYELEDKIENGTLVELEKPYIRQLNSIPQQDKYIICKAQEVGITGVLTKAEAEKKLKELKDGGK